MNQDSVSRKRFGIRKELKLAANPIKKRIRSFSYSVFRLFILITIGYIVLYPLLYLISSSVKTPIAFLDPSVVWVPKIFTLDNYKTAFEVMQFPTALGVTLSMQIGSAIIQIFTCAVAAYGLARFEFKEKKILMLLLILLILIPPQMIIIPQVVNFSRLDFLGILAFFNQLTGIDLRVSVLDTLWTFYLPSIFGVGLRSGIMIFIYYQFFKGLPKELEEAAWIDGSNPFRTFIKISIPSSGVVILTVSVLSMVWHWNDYYLAIIYTSQNQPLAVKLAQLPSNLGTIGIWGSDLSDVITFAGCCMFVFPILIMYMILQRRFVKSIDRVGITG